MPRCVIIQAQARGDTSVPMVPPRARSDCDAITPPDLPAKKFTLRTRRNERVNREKIEECNIY